LLVILVTAPSKARPKKTSRVVILMMSTSAIMRPKLTGDWPTADNFKKKKAKDGEAQAVVSVDLGKTECATLLHTVSTFK